LVFRSPIGNTPFQNTSARFYVSYKYVDGSTGKVNSVINEPLALPDNVNWNNDTSSGMDNANHVLQGLLRKILPLAAQPRIVAGSIQVTARAELVFTASGTVPSIASIAGGTTPLLPLGTSQDDGTRGFVKLPPVYNNSIPPTTLLPNVQVSVDYLVPGWNTLFNQSVSDSSGKVYLPVNLLDSNFSVVGLVASQNEASPAVPVMPSSVDDKKGLVTYGNSNVSIRTAYQGLDQWNSQISPSAESYVPFNNDATIAGFRDIADPEHYYLPHEPWREYSWDSSAADTIYFHPNEAGKTVQVRFLPTGSTQAIQQVLTINENVTAAPASVPAGYSSTGKVATLELKDSNGNAIAADGILGIRGVGIIARTAWLNGDKFNQSVVKGYRITNAG
jgi:hypothetical protein